MIKFPWQKRRQEDKSPLPPAPPGFAYVKARHLLLGDTLSSGKTVVGLLWPKDKKICVWYGRDGHGYKSDSGIIPGDTLMRIKERPRTLAISELAVGDRVAGCGRVTAIFGQNIWFDNDSTPRKIEGADSVVVQ